MEIINQIYATMYQTSSFLSTKSKVTLAFKLVFFLIT